MDQEIQPDQTDGLKRIDYAILATFCLLLFGFALINGRILSSHETVHCQNVREMLADHDWVIPKYGGRPWLERPPLPHWLTAAGVVLFSHWDGEWTMRFSSVIAGTGIVLLVAWLASLWYGRWVGLLSGVALAAMRGFAGYAMNAECDIFLCGIVTAAIACFAWVEFCHPPDRTGFLGTRSWPMLGFFVFLGLTNLAKGLFFGMLFVLIPVVGYLVLSFNWQSMRRYFWFWGWLAFAAVALAWPVAAYLRQPGIIDLWKSDYLGRLNQGYMHEPWWYYLVNLPWSAFPMNLAVFIGAWITAGKAWREKRSPERFLWCWTFLPLIAFSIPQGKHHHYMLHCLAPWAIFAALGARRLWQFIIEAPAWLRHPGFGLLVVGLPGSILLAILALFLPESFAWTVGLVLGWLLFTALLWWGLRQNGRVASVTVCVLLLVTHCLTYDYRTRRLNRYKNDTAFVAQVRDHVSSNEDLFVKFDFHALDGSWFLYYLKGQGKLLHNLTFLRDDRITRPEIYLIARQGDAHSLTRFGKCEKVLQSSGTRMEESVADRWTLFRLRFHESLKRIPGNIPISPMQATGRAVGPFLN